MECDRDVDLREKPVVARGYVLVGTITQTKLLKLSWNVDTVENIQLGGVRFLFVWMSQ